MYNLSNRAFLRDLAKTLQGQPAYKTKQASLFFSPVTRFISRNSFGQQLHITPQLIGDNKVKFRTPKQDLIEENVEAYIQNFTDPKGKLQIFKNNLATRLQQIKGTIRSYSLQQIADFYPWVMSNQLLFQPLRTIIYCLGQKIPPQQAQATMNAPAAQVNESVNNTLYNAVKYNNGISVQAQNIFIQVTGSLLSAKWVQWLARTTTMSKAFMSTFRKIQGQLDQIFTNRLIYATFSKIASLSQRVFTNMLSWLKGQRIGMDWTAQLRRNALGRAALEQQPNFEVSAEQAAKAKSVLGKYTAQIFQTLRSYGQILINYTYLEHTAQKKIIEGTMVYYYPQKPEILIGIRNSLPAVYRLQGRQLVLIPQYQFTKDFLRKLIQIKSLQYAGRMMADIDDQISKTRQQKAAFRGFENQYLNWDNKPRYTNQQFNNLSTSIQNIRPEVNNFERDNLDLGPVQQLQGIRLKKMIAQQRNKAKLNIQKRKQIRKQKY